MRAWWPETSVSLRIALARRGGSPRARAGRSADRCPRTAGVATAGSAGSSALPTINRSGISGSSPGDSGELTDVSVWSSAEPIPASLSPSGQRQARRSSWGVLICKTTPSPSWPLWLPPQHQTEPSARNAQVWLAPAAIATTLSSPATSTGALVGDSWPSPSWPTSLAPQHQTWPAPASAQVWAPPVAMASAAGGPTTGVGRQTTSPGSLPSCCRCRRAPSRRSGRRGERAGVRRPGRDRRDLHRFARATGAPAPALLDWRCHRRRAGRSRRGPSRRPRRRWSPRRCGRRRSRAR